MYLFASGVQNLTGLPLLLLLCLSAQYMQYVQTLAAKRYAMHKQNHKFWLS